jgi:hypothetical protein
MMSQKPITTLYASAMIDEEFNEEVDIQIPVKLAKNFVCGGVDDVFTTRFSVSVRGLDLSGFVYEVKSLIDDIKANFDPDQGMLKASCEELAGGVVNSLWSSIGSRRLVAAHVEVDNRTGHVEIDWKEGDEVPSFPRFATASERGETEREASGGSREERPRDRC